MRNITLGWLSIQHLIEHNRLTVKDIMEIVWHIKSKKETTNTPESGVIKHLGRQVITSVAKA
jgi:hypothetical protein